MELIIGNNADIIAKSQAIRHKVFVIEQGIPLELDLDGLDENCCHALVTVGDLPIATARLFTADGKHAIMARVAVAQEYRHSGIATKVVKALITHAAETNVVSIEIHAHEYLREYYERFGFEFVQEVEIVGGHQLIEMHYPLKRL
ncbi:GNAT family N-acetyltransferase [Desulfogranum japonicum]|uniref:GNAT family N-acetyltransferase n=1 Tax=Desulfogranum japonicum TaxID=231447 RepID=UPI00048C2462|nr:GNAT family N-acetyltransferase [Desulfogranum japonicum]